MEPTDEECQWQSDEEDDENEDKEEKKEEDVTQLTVSWMFWFVMLKSIFVLLLSFRLNAQLNFLGNISVWDSAHNFILDFWKMKMSLKKKDSENVS